MKRGRTLLILCAVLVLCVGGYLIAASVTVTPGEDAQEAETYEVFALNEEDVFSIKWQYAGEDIRLEKAGDSWQYAGDASFPLVQSYPQAMLREAAAVTSSQKIEEPEDLSEYGLDTPILAIALTTAQGETTSYEIGNQNALTEEYYLLLNGDVSTIWTISSALVDAFSYGLYDMIQVEMLPEIGDVQAVTVERADGTLQLAYIEDNDGLTYTNAYHWFLTEGDSYQALATSKVMELYEAFTQAEWLSCVTYNATDEELAGYRLDDPVVTASVVYLPAAEHSHAEEADESDDETPQEAQTFTLLLGDYASDTYCYARLPGSAMVYLVDASIIDSLLYAGYDSLRPDDVCPLDWDTVTGFDVTVDGVTRTVLYEGTETTTDEEGATAAVYRYSTDGQALDGTSVRNALGQISRMTAIDTAEGASGRGELLSFTFRRDAERDQEIVLTFHQYNSTYDLVEFNGEKRLLVTRSSVTSLMNAVEALFTVGEGAE